MIPGLTVRTTSAGIPVARVHYSADSHKRPGTAEGAVWLKQASAGYPGGTRSPRWRKEMEIDYGALGGTRLFPEWENWRAAGRIVIAPFDPVGYRFYGAYDHGWRNPASFHVYGINSDGMMICCFEFYGSHVPYQYVADIIKGKTVVVPPSGCCEIHDRARVFQGNPFAGKEVWKRADPSMWAEDQPQNDKTNKSMAHLYSKAGISFQPAEKGTDTTVAEWLLSYYWKNPGNPLYRIFDTCPMLIWEIGQQRHRTFSAQVALNREQPEELVDKDNHAWDDQKYFLQKFPPAPQKREAAKGPNTFNWWRETVKRANDGRAVGSYRVTV